jgi:hypothetical protein
MTEPPLPTSTPSPPAPGFRRRWTNDRAVTAALTALFLVLAAVYVGPLWQRLDTWGGTFDWGYFFFLAEVDRTSIVQYHQIPLWNPYYCGGSVHMASPQTFFLGPTFLFIVAFGTPIGIRLTLTVAVLLAFDGMRRFCRVLGLGAPAATVAAAGYAFSGTLAQHLGGGHVAWVGFCVLPYVLHSFHRALAGERRHILYGGLFLAWIFGHFGAYTFPYSLLCLGCYGLLVGVARRRVRAAIAIMAVMFVLSVGLTAVRLLPILEHMRGHPRIRPDADIVSPHEFFEIYAGRHEARSFVGHPYVWPEYGNYLGVPALVLLAIGMGVTVKQKLRPLMPVAVAMGLFALFQIGNIPGFPWWLVKHLPLFEYMRAPSRFTILVGLFACVFIGAAIDRMVPAILERQRRQSDSRVARAVGAAVAILSIVFLFDAMTFNRGQWSQTLTTPPPADRVAPAFKQTAGDKRRMYAYPRSNQGSIACFEEVPVDISPRLRAGAPADEYPLDPGTGTVRRRTWTPNRIELDVSFSRPGTVVVNQNFHPAWRVDGGVAVNEGGLLAARVAAGRHTVVFRFLPASFLIGLGVTALTLIAMAVLWWRWRRLRDVRASGAGSSFPSGSATGT